MSNEPTNKEMFNMNSVKATPDSVGEWEGQEQKAADNINRIQDALYEAAPDVYDDDQLHDIMKAAWDNWGSEEALITVTDAQIKAYVSKVMYKVIRVTLPTYGYLMDHRTLYLKSMDSVIWDMIEEKSKSEAEINEFERINMIIASIDEDDINQLNDDLQLKFYKSIVGDVKRVIEEDWIPAAGAYPKHENE